MVKSSEDDAKILSLRDKMQIGDFADNGYVSDVSIYMII